MQVQFFHGGSITLQDARSGYEPKKRNVNRVQYGVGLYCTPEYDWAAVYGRSVKCITAECDPSKSLNNVMVAYHDVCNFIYYTFSKAFYKAFRKEYDPKELTEMDLRRLEVYIMNHDRRPHTKAAAINNFFVVSGADFSIENSSNGDLIRIFNTRIITSIEKPVSYDLCTKELRKHCLGY